MTKDYVTKWSAADSVCAGGGGLFFFMFQDVEGVTESSPSVAELG